MVLWVVPQIPNLILTLAHPTLGVPDLQYEESIILI